MSMHLRRLAKKGESRTKILTHGGIKDWGPGMTKQAFKDQCDINKMLSKAQREGSLAHLQKYPAPVYGEFDGEFTLQDAVGQIDKANVIFDALPSEIRREFDNNAMSFVSFAADPANNGRLRELLPALAKPGNYFPNPVVRGGSGAGAATAPSGAVAGHGPAEPAASGDPSPSGSPGSGD